MEPPPEAMPTMNARRPYWPDRGRDEEPGFVETFGEPLATADIAGRA